MRVVKGTVVGKTVVIDEVLPEGTSVAVVVQESGEADDFVLTDEMQCELEEAAESMRRGEGVDMDVVLKELEAL